MCCPGNTVTIRKVQPEGRIVELTVSQWCADSYRDDPRVTIVRCAHPQWLLTDDDAAWKCASCGVEEWARP